VVPLHRIFLHLPLCISYGILIGVAFFPQQVYGLPLIVMIIGMLLCSLAIVLSTSTDFLFTARLLMLLIIFILTWLRIIRLNENVSVHFPFPPHDITLLEGEARFDSSRSDKGNLVVELSISYAENRHGDLGQAKGVLLVVVDSDVTVLFGETIRVFGSLKEFDGRMLFLADSLAIAGKKGGMRNAYQQLRKTILDWVTSRLDQLPPEQSSICGALLIGRSGPDSEIREHTTLSGCAHVLALSGMHLHAVIALLAILLGPLLRTHRIPWITLPVAIIYVAVVGNRPSLLRALLMTILGPLCTRIPLRHCMAYVMMAHTWLFGHTLFSTGSILSYMALSGIFFVAPTIASLFSLIMPKSIALVISVSLGASLATAPFTFATFGSWYPIGMCIGPILAPVALAILLCALVWLVCPWYPVAYLMKFCSGWFERLVEWGSEWTLSHPNANTGSACMTLVVVLLTVLGILKYAGRIERKRSFKRHDMGFSLRFGQCDHRSARASRLCDVEKVRTELPVVRIDSTKDRR